MNDTERQVKRLDTLDALLTRVEGQILDIAMGIQAAKRDILNIKERIEDGRESDHKLN
jgi:hypothetical protein